MLVLRNLPGTLSAEPGRIAPRLELAPPRANPFLTGVALELSIPAPAPVRLEIYDLQGRRLRTLQDGVLAPGLHVRSWDGTTTSGSAARTGVYLVRLTALGVHRTRKLLLVR